MSENIKGDGTMCICGATVAAGDCCSCPAAMTMRVYQESTETPQIGSILQKASEVTMDNMTAYCKEIVDAHWSYIEKLLLVQSVTDHQISIIGFHYKTAMAHGFKHGVEYCLDLEKCTDEARN